jgi:hypothetical protein
LLSASQDHPRVRNFHGNIPASCLHEFQVPLRGVSNDLPVGTDLWINQGEASVDIDILADPADVSTWLIQLSRRPRQTPLPSPAIIMSFQFFRFGHKLNCDGKKITHDTQSQNFWQAQYFEAGRVPKQCLKKWKLPKKTDVKFMTFLRSNTISF